MNRNAYSSYLAARRPRRVARVHVGAPPALVEAGAPGARDEVRAYATRIDDAWKQFWSDDVKPWASENLDREESDAGESVGDVIGSDRAAVKEKKRLIALYESIAAHRRAFMEYRDEISSFSITGPTPSEAWQTLQTHEDALNEDRDKLQAESKKPLKSKKPKPLEVPGGVDQGIGKSLKDLGDVGSKVAGSILPWVAGAVVGLGAIVLLSRK